ncbi:MAG: metal ABC transporter ATP-binding protein [Alphaproteobacteria bacterium]|nr:metal ABC transporter ATP-binding protein [Alphaproteobacteria bacterium SS10]
MARQLKPALDPDIRDAALAVRGLTVSYGARPVIFSVDLTVPKGAMMAIVGPNGAGKSTLIKGALGIQPAMAGTASMFGKAVSDARDQFAYVPQRAAVDWDFPVRVLDVVLMGAYRRLGPFRWTGKAERDLAMTCLEQVGMTDFATRQIGALSGGQQQRVFLARALAQQADLLILDEPFAGVDAATEQAIIGVLRNLRDQGKTVLAVHHDLNTLGDYFDRVLMINTQCIAEGPMATTLTDDNLKVTYGGQLEQLAASA